MNFDNIKKRLKMKAMNIYIIPIEERKELAFKIWNIDNIDQLIEVQYKIDELMNSLKNLTDTLLEKIKPSMLLELKATIQGSLSIKKTKKVSNTIDLEELDNNLDKMLDNI